MPDRDQALNEVIIQSAEAVDGAWWDDAVGSAPGATVFQSSGWAAYLRSLSQDPWFLWSADEAGRPQTALLVHRFRPAPRSLLGRLLGRGGEVSWGWRHAPLVIGPGRDAPLAALIAQVERDASRAPKVRIQRVTPPLADGREAVDSVLTGRGWTPTRQATILIDLRPAEETLWRALRPAARKAVAKSERDGLKVRRLLPEEPLDDYLDLLKQTRERLGFGLPPHYPSPALRQAFRGTAAVCEVFVAERNGQVLGGMGVIGFGATVVEIAIAQSQVALAEKLYTNDAIKWAVIRWAREAGFRWYDLGGIDPEPKDPKAAAIRQFKEKWGGAVVEFAAYSWPA